MSLADIQQQLVERQTELQQRLDRVEEHASHRDAPLSADFSEQAVERENDEVLEAIGHEVDNELLHIKQALKRLESGVYGQCEDCSELIAVERLKAVPYATQCIGCASRAS